jgi:hypothetical protein
MHDNYNYTNFHTIYKYEKVLKLATIIISNISFVLNIYELPPGFGNVVNAYESILTSAR